MALVGLWGCCSFSLCAMLQAEAVRHAWRAPNIASTLNISSFNLGNAIGASLAALTLSRGLSLSCLPAVAGLIALIGFMLTLAWIGISARDRNRLAGRPSSPHTLISHEFCGRIQHLPAENHRRTSPRPRISGSRSGTSDGDAEVRDRLSCEGDNDSQVER